MLKMAYKAIGADYEDLNGGDMDSEEMSEVNKVSPVKAFKGYPRCELENLFANNESYRMKAKDPCVIPM